MPRYSRKRPPRKRQIPTLHEVEEARARKSNPFAIYQTDPIAYIEEKLGMTVWSGRNGQPGQREVLLDIAESIRKQFAGEPADQIFRIEAGHGVGKTVLAAMLVNWFFDAFAPSIITTTAPTKPAVVQKLWKNVKKIRRGKGLPGRVLPSEPKMEKREDHFAIGMTTSDSGGQGTERFQGQHDEYLFFVLDEAEGLPDFVYNAVGAMMTGGKILLALVCANPRTRSSRFHRLGKEAGVKSYRQSLLDFPNVVDNADTVPGGTSRAWVQKYIGNLCDPASDHDEDAFTFTVPYTATKDGHEFPPGQIWRPTTEFMFRVMGVAPVNSSADTFVPVGRYEAACKRPPKEDRPTMARIGIDAAGFGDDLGTIWVRWNGRLWRAAQCSKPDGDQDDTDYWQKTKRTALQLKQQGVTDLQIRIDAGGGFGKGVYSRLTHDAELMAAFPGMKVHLVHFGGVPSEDAAYADLATELYAHAAESLKGISILQPPQALEADLCERRYMWVNKSSIDVRKLQPKDIFRKDHGRSPDDGDGLVLACGADYLFVERVSRVERPSGNERKRYTFA